MYDIISKIVSAGFVLLIYWFIFMVVKMIYSDIRVMSRKKSGLPVAEAYIKPINLPHNPGFKVQESYPLTGNDTVGRAPSCQISIDDSFMSHEHARIFREGDGYYLEDRGSTNGTVLNGKAVSEDAIELLDGDRICIGQLEFIFLRPGLKNGEVTL